jgi:biofilm PGA synthesis N-glycosyltransferase PgaC
VATVWPGGWPARLVAAPLVIEIAYAFYLQANFILSCWDIAFNRQKRWGHITPAAIKDVS